MAALVLGHRLLSFKDIMKLSTGLKYNYIYLNRQMYSYSDCLHEVLMLIVYAADSQEIVHQADLVAWLSKPRDHMA